MKELHFQCGGDWYKVNSEGHMTQDKNNSFSGGWLLLGVSFHHWRSGIDERFKDIFDNPGLMIGGLVWDLDHGTTRQWGGSYHGRLPRVTHAHKREGG